MKKGRIITILTVVMILLMVISAGPITAGERATPEEVVARVREAAEFLSKEGEAGLLQFNDPEGPWVWKDTYAFVEDCNKDEIVAHPDSELVGTSVSGLVDIKGNNYGLEICPASENPNGGWVEYWWPELGGDVPERKVTYYYAVPDQPYIVGAGVYEPTMTMEELNELIE